MNRFWNPQDDENRLAESAAWRLRLTEAGVRTSPEFEAWLREPGNQAAWDQVSRPWNYFDETDNAPAMVAAREAALADAKRNRDRFAKPQQLRRLAGLIAAALLIGAMGAGSVWWLNLPDDYRTAMGERRVITLSDGSKLSLDADSEVTVRYAKHDRALHLLKGQARFDVAHDKKRPFSVVAGNQRVIATGTAFNIDMAGPKVLVTLIEGHVLVLNENDDTAAMPMHPGPRAIELRAGTAWTIGQLMFDDEPLSSVVERVNRYGGTQIVIADPRVGAMKISGVFNAGDALGFVEIVTQYLPLKAVSDGSHTIALQREPRKNQSM
jgi:transmembrane sensor